MKIVRSKIVYDRMKDPKFLKLLHSEDTLNRIVSRKEIEDYTPPEIFVGTVGYPKVYVGPVISIGVNPEIAGYPNKWIGMSINDIVKMRSSTLRGEKPVGIREFNKVVQELQIAALSSKPSLANIDIAKINKAIYASDETAISGPSFRFENVKVKEQYSNYFAEKVYYDSDFSAKDAILYLYSNRFSVYDIQRLLSIGAIGLKSQRKLVPTRWSITAVDDTISKYVVEKIKQNETIPSIRAYSLYSLGNKWIVAMFPGSWEYESIEVFYPGTAYNDSKDYAFIYSSYEDLNGRKTYAEMGGCYYAARLVVSEYLNSIKKVAKILILREVYDEYKIPLGVWNVRENVRLTLQQNYTEFNSLYDFLQFVKENTVISLQEWIKNSKLLRNLLFNKSLLQV